MDLKGVIGVDFTASAFVDELRYLENNGAKSIDIYINSPGGIVLEAYSIFAAIIKSKASITTFNVGLAGSCASWIFLAAPTAVMMDYSFIFVHNPASEDNSAKGREMVEYMRQSILTIIAKRTGNTAEMIGQLMDEDTLLNASEAMEMGFATSVEETSVLVEVEASVTNLVGMYQVFNNVLAKNKNVNMSEVIDQVEEVIEEVATEVEEVVAEVEAQVEEVVKEVVEEVKADEVTNLADVTNQLSLVTNELTTSKARITELETELATLRAAEVERELGAKTAAGVELVTNAIAAGKLKADAKEKWVAQAVANYADTKEMLDAIVTNKAGFDVKSFLNVKTDNQEKPKMGLREMEKKEPEKVYNMYTTNRAAYDQLYFEEYGVMPK